MFCVFTVTLVVLLLFTMSPTFVHADKLVDNRCTTKRTCGACIAVDPSCSWCKQESYELGRCDLRENLLRKNCHRNNIVSPKSVTKIRKSKPLSEAGVKSDAYVQLHPQEIHIKLRPHEVVTIPIEFRQAEDYPIDLYYLMDLTYSMRDDKEKLSELGDMLVNDMSKLTSNFRMGFGSFVDKVALPYVNMVPAKLLNPCLDEVVCVPPYGFRNHMPLSNQTERFVREVENAQVSANLDDAEGGFDAIMQVLVCKHHIDWNEKSRKIVLFATDSGFHYAGDGKLGGVVIPNDEHCHLDDMGYYTMSTKYDYPSISQLNRKVKEHKVILIFAVTSNQLRPYTELSKAVEGAYTQELATDSSNIVRLVREQYQTISSEIEMKADNVPDNVKLTFQSICPDGKKGNHLCKGLKVGTTVSFNVSLELEGCPKTTAGSWSHEITVYPVGINEALQIQLEMLCECDCELPDQEEANSTLCSDMGTYECGICNCYDSRFGRKCECNATDLDEEKHLALCMAENSTAICSGRGECVCGICECWADPQGEVDGPQCQCDNFSCDRDEEQQICGGPTRGKCECGNCECKSGWNGTACTCSTSNETCIGSNGLMCSGNGVCDCGRCQCKETFEGRFGGTTCDDCPSCSGKCSEFRHCVECLVWDSGEFSRTQCKSNCSSFTSIVVSDLEGDDNKRCTFQDAEGCTFHFTYAFNELNRPVVKVLEEKECPKAANVTFIIVGLVGGILLVGLLIILIGRLLLYVKDRRDYARFLEDLETTKWGKEENPIYKAATSKFTNPTYGSNVKN